MDGWMDVWMVSLWEELCRNMFNYTSFFGFFSRLYVGMFGFRSVPALARFNSQLERYYESAPSQPCPAPPSQSLHARVGSLSWLALVAMFYPFFFFFRRRGGICRYYLSSLSSTTSPSSSPNK